MESGTLLGLVKTAHIFFVSLGLGGILIQSFLLRKFRHAGAGEAAASERMALAVTKFAESYGLMIAFVTGLILGMMTGEFKGRSYLHVKSLLALVLVGLAHVDLRNLKRMIALREGGQAEAADQVKQKHLFFSTVNTVLVIIVVVLVVLKPF